MRQILLSVFMMIAAGVFGFVEGRDWAQSPNVIVVETDQPHVVFAATGTRQQKEARQQSEGCPVVPNGDLRQQKSSGQDSSIMKGLVF